MTMENRAEIKTLQPEARVRLTDVVIGYRRHKHGDKPIASFSSGALYGGEMVCLLGPNGAGKSTMLRTLCGFLPPLRGEITIDGQPLEALSPKDMARRLSIVLTEKSEIRGVTVEGLVGLGRSPYTDFWGRLKEADNTIVEEAMRAVGIYSFRNRMLNTLSDGERQKAFIAKALAQESPIIFLDEPTAFLDYPSKVEVMQMLRHLTRQKGITVFLSTHDVELALQTADRLWVMDSDRTVSFGTPEELARNGVLEKTFCRPGIEFLGNTLQFKIKKDE